VAKLRGALAGMDLSTKEQRGRHFRAQHALQV
jgi:hypothetical protein